MSSTIHLGPRQDSWTVAIYGRDPRYPVGAGVLIDRHRVLTCAHVVSGESRQDGETLSVAFPKAGLARAVRRRVARIRIARDTDAALLVLDEPAPHQATPAPLRSPAPADLVGDRWWAFGFPRDAEYGTDAYGVVDARLAYGWIRLESRSRYVVKPGFSGAALWSNNFQAVVGLVGQAQRGGEHRGDALAVTLHQVVEEFPDERLAELSAWSLEAVGESALEAWGWSLGTDAEAVRHWRPRARGVAIDSEAGYRFRGRAAALTEVVGWLRRTLPDRRVLLVTGSPGVGKSAVLGRIVTTADAGVRAALPSDDHNLRAPLGSIACAVHAKGKTALDVAAEIARAASVRVPRAVEDLPPALRRRLERRPGTRFNLVLDALDEATSPAQARLIISGLLVPVAQTCARHGAQVIVGTRRVDDGGNLLRAFGGGTKVIDLDLEEFFAERDLADYALATLALVGDERPGNPYTDIDVAMPVARRIAALADRNFLIAGLVARTHGLYDTEPVDSGTLAFTPTVDAALAEYLRRLPGLDQVPAATVLTALAYAQAPGLSVELWRVALGALGAQVGRDQLTAFVGSSAANFLVESSSDAGTRRYRLFHQALNDALLRERNSRGAQEADQRAVARALIGHGRQVGWGAADPYLLSALPIYADRAGMIDQLLTDDSFLLHADLPRLTQLGEHAATEPGRARTRLLHLTPQAIAAPPAERAALFGVTAELDQLGNAFANWRGIPYRARWASATGRIERAVLEGHAGTVRATCPVVVDGQTLLATVGDYRTIRLWDPASGQYQSLPAGHDGPVYAVCCIGTRSRTMLATGGADGTIRLWDAQAGHHLGTLRGHIGPVRALCVIAVRGQLLLASGGDDRAVRLWDLATGRHRVLPGHTGTVNALCALPHGDLASAGEDYGTRLWDPARGRLLGTMHDHVDAVRAVCPIRVRDKLLLATASFRTARLWDVGANTECGALQGHTGVVRAMTAIVTGGREALATAGDDGTVRIWDPETESCRRVLTGHSGAVTAICPAVVDGQTMLVTGGHDRTVRLWDLAAARRGRASDVRGNRVSAVCPVDVNGRHLVAAAGSDSHRLRMYDVQTGDRLPLTIETIGGLSGICTVRLRSREPSDGILLDPTRDLIVTASPDAVEVWDAATGQRMPQRIREFGGLRAVCAVETDDGRTLLATAGHPRKVIQLWNPVTGRQVRTALLRGRFNGSGPRHRHARGIEVVHQFTLDGRPVLATAGEDAQVMIWTLGGQHLRTLSGHQAAVRALCSLRVDGRTLLATGGADRTVRIWDPSTAACECVIAGHMDRVNALCPITVDGEPMLASGGQDRMVRIWDVDGQVPYLTIPVHHPALACVEASGLLFVGLTAGSLVLDVNPGRSDLDYFREIR